MYLKLDTMISWRLVVILIMLKSRPNGIVNGQSLRGQEDNHYDVALSHFFENHEGGVTDFPPGFLCLDVVRVNLSKPGNHTNEHSEDFGCHYEKENTTTLIKFKDVGEKTDRNIQYNVKLFLKGATYDASTHTIDITKNVEFVWLNRKMQNTKRQLSSTTVNPSSSPSFDFDPTSTLTSYFSQGICGPRGANANADLSQCTNGADLVYHQAWDSWKIVASVNGCNYWQYEIYECKTLSPSLAPTLYPTSTAKPSLSMTPTSSVNPSSQPTFIFDPTSTLVSYQDESGCGPRGANANANWSQCPHGVYSVYHQPYNSGNVVTTVGSCNYYEYQIYACLTLAPSLKPTISISPTISVKPSSQPSFHFDPTSTLVTYFSEGTCGPRGAKAFADLSQCSDGSYLVYQQLWNSWNIVATVDSCNYFEYKIYACVPSGNGG